MRADGGEAQRYTPAIALARTAAERESPALSWARDDRRFFASGACHILAFRAVQGGVAPALRVFLLRPERGGAGHHVFASDGEWALDFNGWTPHELLVRESLRACRAAYPGGTWSCSPIDCDLPTFCRRHAHRQPEQFPHDAIRRADAWLARLGPRPTGPARG